MVAGSGAGGQFPEARRGQPLRAVAPRGTVCRPMNWFPFALPLLVALPLPAQTDADKAKVLVARLAEHGVKAYTEQKGEVTRVRVGPFSSREQADKALAKVQSAGASGMIISR